MGLLQWIRPLQVKWGRAFFLDVLADTLANYHLEVVGGLSPTSDAAGVATMSGFTGRLAITREEARRCARDAVAALQEAGWQPMFSFSVSSSAVAENALAHALYASAHERMERRRERYLPPDAVFVEVVRKTINTCLVITFERVEDPT